MNHVHSLANHPFRNGLIFLGVAVITFVLTNVIPGAQNINNPAFALVWGGIPLVGIVGFITLTTMGVVRKIRA